MHVDVSGEAVVVQSRVHGARRALPDDRGDCVVAVVGGLSPAGLRREALGHSGVCYEYLGAMALLHSFHANVGPDFGAVGGSGELRQIVGAFDLRVRTFEPAVDVERQTGVRSRSQEISGDLL